MPRFSSKDKFFEAIGTSQDDRLVSREFQKFTTLDGQAGNDTLVFRGGHDALFTGSSGFDRFVFNTDPDGVVVITDWTYLDTIWIDDGVGQVTHSPDTNGISINGELAIIVADAQPGGWDESFFLF